MAPFADLLYFADSRWWQWHREKPEFKAFAGEKCCIWVNGNAVDDPAVHMLRAGDAPDGISMDSEVIHTGKNSGYQLINIFALAGVKRIVLLGYDCKAGAGGKMHWFGDHPIKTQPSVLPEMAKMFATAAKPLSALGIDVVNCSPGSAIGAFRKDALESVLPAA